MSTDGSRRVRVVSSPSRAATALAAGSLVVLASVGTSVLVLSSTSGVAPGTTVQAGPRAPGSPGGERPAQSVVVVPPRPGTLLPSTGPFRLPFSDRDRDQPAGSPPLPAELPAARLLPTDPAAPLASGDIPLPVDGTGAAVTTPDSPAIAGPVAPGTDGQPPAPAPDGPDTGGPDTPRQDADRPGVARPDVDRPGTGRPAEQPAVDAATRPYDVLHGGHRARRAYHRAQGNAYGHLLAPGLDATALLPGTAPAPRAGSVTVDPLLAVVLGPPPAAGRPEPGAASPGQSDPAAPATSAAADQPRTDEGAANGPDAQQGAANKGAANKGAANKGAEHRGATNGAAAKGSAAHRAAASKAAPKKAAGKAAPRKPAARNASPPAPRSRGKR